MTYASVSDVKAYLLIPNNVTDYDVEIENIISFVNQHVNNILNRYFAAADLPLSNNHSDYFIVKNYEAMWAAGEFRKRRENLSEDHIFIRLAREGLERYLAEKYVRIQLF